MDGTLNVPDGIMSLKLNELNMMIDYSTSAAYITLMCGRHCDSGGDESHDFPEPVVVLLAKVLVGDSEADREVSLVMTPEQAMDVAVKLGHAGMTADQMPKLHRNPGADPASP